MRSVTETRLLVTDVGHIPYRCIRGTPNFGVKRFRAPYPRFGRAAHLVFRLSEVIRRSGGWR